MDVHKAARDPWVWGQLLLILLVIGLPVLRDLVGGSELLSRLLHRADNGTRLIALMPLLAGFAIGVWGAVSLGPNLTPGTEPLAEGRLVEGGAYRLVRHPVYLGLILVLWGLGWWLANAVLGLAVAILAGGFFDRKAAVEERWMRQRFPSYEAYTTRVPKLIPHLPI